MFAIPPTFIRRLNDVFFTYFDIRLTKQLLRLQYILYVFYMSDNYMEIATRHIFYMYFLRLI